MCGKILWRWLAFNVMVLNYWLMLIWVCCKGREVWGGFTSSTIGCTWPSLPFRFQNLASSSTYGCDGLKNGFCQDVWRFIRGCVDKVASGFVFHEFINPPRRQIYLTLWHRLALIHNLSAGLLMNCSIRPALVSHAKWLPNWARSKIGKQQTWIFDECWRGDAVGTASCVIPS